MNLLGMTVCEERRNHAQRVEVCFEPAGGTRRFGRERRRAIQERKPGDRAEHSATQPARYGVAADWSDGYHHHISPAGGGWAGDLGKDGPLREGVARGREREYNHHFFR